MDKDIAEVIKTRLHPKIEAKQSIWKLIHNSYIGGIEYISKDNLFQYSLESNADYIKRVARSVYFNHVQPLADMLVGFLYSEHPDRSSISDEFTYLIEKATHRLSFDSFMHFVATHSLLYTVGVLVDSPVFDPDKVNTIADRRAEGLNPYCILYYPSQIKDFHFDKNGRLAWVLLDNSYYDNSNPLQEAGTVTIYRLWTPDNYTDFLYEGEDVTITTTDIDLGEIPFTFVNWRDVGEDGISDSTFEDIALLSRQIYNYISYLDESVASSCFKPLFYPMADNDDIPKDLISGGLSALSIVPYNGSLSARPFFDSPALTDIDSIMSVMAIFNKEILSKAGLDKDEDRNYVQSGIAKSIEFEKCEAILRIGASQMEQTEKKIFRFAGLWEGKTDVETDINYTKSFQSEDIDIQLERLYNLFAMPIKQIKDVALDLIVQKSLNSVGAEPQAIESAKKYSIEELYEFEQTSRDENE